MKMSNLLVLLAVLCLFAACQRSGPYEAINNADSASVLTSATDSAADGNIAPKLVKTGEMRFKVKDVQETSNDIIILTRNYKGMVMHQNIDSSPGRTNEITLSRDSVKRISSFNTIADMSVKIPSDSLHQFMNAVGKMSVYVNVRKMDIEDKTLDYLSSKLKLESRSQIISQQKKGKIILKKPEDVLWLKDDMIDQKIYNKRIDDAVRYSIVDLNFYQSNTITQETIANDNPEVYQLGFGQRLGLALNNGWEMFTAFIIGLVHLWVFILAGCGIWMAYRMYKRKNHTVISSI